MSCEECERGRQIDGDVPRCETEQGCIIPSLEGTGARVMAMRERLTSLKGLVDSGTVLALYEATREDLEMLAKVEEAMGTMKQPGSMKNG